jgi:hypothetical protein
LVEVKALAIDGHTIMKLANKSSGPWIGELQKYLLEAVVDEPKLNTVDDLERLANLFLNQN